MQSLGADLMNLIPLIPLPATDLAEFDPPHPAEIKRLRSLAGQYVPQMYHCGRCRSDAAGLLDSGHIPFGHRQKK
jgi:nitrogen fixation protein NifB